MPTKSFGEPARERERGRRDDTGCWVRPPDRRLRSCQSKNLLRLIEVGEIVTMRAGIYAKGEGAAGGSPRFLIEFPAPT